MSKFDIFYILEKATNGEITKIHWHVPGKTDFGRMMSRIVQGLTIPISINRPTTDDGIINLIVDMKTEKENLSAERANTLKHELRKVAETGICFDQNCRP